MTEGCPEALRQAIEQFNQQQFYRCHDTLEALWSEAGEPQRTFYQGLLQIAVALHHRENNNHRGAVILLGEGMRRLQRYKPDYETVDVSSLMLQCQELQKSLQASFASARESSQHLANGAEAQVASLRSPNSNFLVPAITQLPLSEA